MRKAAEDVGVECIGNIVNLSIRMEAVPQVDSSDPSGVFFVIDV